MPILGVATFCFIFLAISRSLLQPESTPQSPNTTKNDFRIELSGDLQLEDLEHLLIHLKEVKSSEI